MINPISGLTVLHPVHRELPPELHLIWFISEPASPADAVSAGQGRGSGDALRWMPAGFPALLKHSSGVASPQILHLTAWESKHTPHGSHPGVSQEGFLIFPPRRERILQ